MSEHDLGSDSVNQHVKQPPPFAVISGAQVQATLAGREQEIVDLVEAAYRWHGEGDSVNPPSYFLTFPDRPTARIIALPASLGGKVRVDGLKWVSSFPENVPAGSAEGFRGYLAARAGETARLTVHESADELIRASDLVVFATVAAKPHVTDRALFDHHPVVLHISLRDLSPEILLDAVNIVDDVDHCLKADTSPHLVEQLTGNREFLAGTLYDVMTGQVEIPADRTVVFSPFGLGVLDLAVGKHVYDSVLAAGELNVIADFFHDLKRHG
jgi:ornithine cyclodeaminase/alanine dehydrogenase-like protein (mu-crystallin family)